MKHIIRGLLFLSALFFSYACSDSDNDDRIHDEARIVGIKLNEKLYTKNVSEKEHEFKYILPPGTKLESVTTQVLVSSGFAIGYEIESKQDLRFPLDIALQGNDGQKTDWKLIVQSPPKIQRVTEKDLLIPTEHIFISENAIVIQVEEGTDLTNLAFTYELSNGKLINYNNGEVKNYTEPFVLEVEGVDESTIYKYEVVVTSEKVGPATFEGLNINGVSVDRIEVIDQVVYPYVSELNDYSDITLEPKVGYKNVIDENVKLEHLDMRKDIRMGVKGLDGVELMFTIKHPKIEMAATTILTHEDAQFAANSGSSFGFSGANIVIASHQMAAGATVGFGLNQYSIGGSYIKGLSKEGSNIDGGAVTGVRKMATDADGKVLGVQLGAGAGATTKLAIYKWDNLDSKPVEYINYTQTSLGLGFAPRSAGVNVYGSLSKDAIIAVGMAQKKEVLVWTVTNGTLNPTPKILQFPYAPTTYYFSVQPFGNNFIGADAGTAFKGINIMDSSMGEIAKVTEAGTTDSKVIDHNGRRLVAFTMYTGQRHAHRIMDITSPENPIVLMDIPSRNVGNGNFTTDADFTIIGGKLYAGFYGTNDGLYIYKLEK